MLLSLLLCGSAAFFAGQPVAVAASATGPAVQAASAVRAPALSASAVRAPVLIASAARPSLRFSPDPAPAGSWVSVSGSCPEAHPGSIAVSLISRAFDHAGTHNWDGVNGVWQFYPPGPAGSFTGKVLLRSGTSGSYSVTMRCGGGLAGNWSLRVTPALASTGAAVPEALAAAGVAIVAGVVLLFLGRRRG